ncbi:MAG: hypothetical protein DMG11_30790 [Acidobacteria bacterium]|nr:MAG: hypothetical protein DMG11_30790 [Acidobacteriota bacterium]
MSFCPAVGPSCSVCLRHSLTLATTAFIKGAHRHWVSAWTLALFGLLYSAYLTTISVTVLGAACPYCLTSLALMTSIFVLVTYQRPATLGNFSWPRWLRKTVPVAAAIIVVLHLHYIGILGPAPAPEDPTARALALHLARSGAKMYGAFWCPHCQQQKEIFGASADRLPYIECSPNGQGSPQASECRTARIESYPTWIINGKRTEEVMSLKQLAEATGFQGETVTLTVAALYERRPAVIDRRYSYLAAAGGLMRASSQCSLIKPFSIRTTSKWFHLYSRLGLPGSLAVRSHIMTEYGPLISVSTGAFTHSGLISRGVRPGTRLMNCLKPSRPCGTFGLCWM